MEPVLTMALPAMSGTTARVKWKMPLTVTSWSRSQSSSVQCRMPPRTWTPALLCSASTPPSTRLTSRAAAATWSLSMTSQAQNKARRPRARTLCAACSPRTESTSKLTVGKSANSVHEWT